MFAGLPVIVSPGPVTIVAANTTNITMPQGDQFIRLTDYVAYAHHSFGGSGRILDRVGHHVGSERIVVTQEDFERGFRPIADVAPPSGSMWRNPRSDGSFITVNGHGQGLGAPCQVNVTDEAGTQGTIPLMAFVRDYIRFDEEAAPPIGSIWVCRGNGALVVITDSDVVEGMRHVAVRNADGHILRMLIPDLWRNYTQVEERVIPLECHVGEEWIDQKGVSYTVALLDPALGIATLEDSNGIRVQASARAFLEGGTWKRVERKDAFERLANEDPFGWGD
jgi:hypothetical protein